MVEKRRLRLGVLFSVIALLLASLGCTGLDSTWCVLWQGGEWVYVESHNPFSGTYGCCRTALNQCESADDETGSPAGNDPGQNASACNATPYLQTSNTSLKQETNDFGTRLCEYTLRITNMHPEAPIRYFVYQHDKDGFQRTEGYRWLGNFPLAPGSGTDYPSSRITVYTDEDAEGPVMSIPEKVAGIFDSPECSHYYKDAKFDEGFLESFAVPLSSACPLE